LKAANTVKNSWHKDVKDQGQRGIKKSEHNTILDLEQVPSSDWRLRKNTRESEHEQPELIARRVLMLVSDSVFQSGL
jgi:hypothetical protein